MTDMNINDATSEQLGAAITAQRGHVQALAFVAKGGAGLSSVLHNIWKAKSLERQGKLSVLVYLFNTYTESELSGIPVVGTKKGESGNKPYDRYTTQAKTDSGMKSVPGSWYTDAIRATAESKWIDTVAAWCDGNEEVKPENIPDGIEPKTIRAAELKAEMLKARQDMRAGLVGGCQLYLHSEEISAINPDRIKVKMPIRGDKETGLLVLGGSNMVRLVDPMDGGEDERILTVSEFLALDPAKLVGPGKDQTIKSLMDTKARKPRVTGADKAKGKGAQDIKVPSTVEPFLNICNIVATALDNGTDHGRNLESALLAKFTAKGDAGDDAVMTVGTVCLAFDNLWTLIQDRYNAIAAQRASAMNAKAAAERQAKAG